MQLPGNNTCILVRRHIFVEVFTQTHISQLGLQYTSITHKDIVGFQVTMNNIHCMKMRQSCHNVPVITPQCQSHAVFEEHLQMVKIREPLMKMYKPYNSKRWENYMQNYQLREKQLHQCCTKESHTSSVAEAERSSAHLYPIESALSHLAV